MRRIRFAGGHPRAPGLVLGFALAFLLAGARWPALAHSDLIESKPAYGATVAEAPEQVFLRFNYKLDLSYSQVDLRGPKGQQVKVGKPVFGDGRTSIKLPVADLTPGSFTLTYWLVAEDSHVMGGEVLFKVAAPAAVSVAPTGSAPGPTVPIGGSAPSALPSASKDLGTTGGAAAGPTPEQIALPLTAIPEELGGISEEQAAPAASLYRTTVRSVPLAGFEEMLAGLDYAFLAILVGGAVFLVMAWPAGGDVSKARRLLWGGLLGALVSTLATVAVKVASLTQIAMEGSLRPSVAGGVFGTWFGRAAITRAGLLILAVPLLVVLERKGQKALQSAQWRNYGVLLGLAALATHGAFGHAATGMFGRTVGLIHVVAITVWLGGLVVLGVVVMPRRQGAELVAVVPRFSKMAMSAVVAMAVSGSLLLLLIGPNWGRLLGSGYGKALVTKFFLIGLILGAAHLSRKFVQRRLLGSTTGSTPGAAGRPRPAGRGGNAGTVALGPFVASVGLELVLAAGVLAMTAILTNQPPPV